jgi:hypothetical protein
MAALRISQPHSVQRLWNLRRIHATAKIFLLLAILGSLLAAQAVAGQWPASSGHHQQHRLFGSGCLLHLTGKGINPDNTSTVIITTWLAGKVETCSQADNTLTLNVPTARPVLMPNLVQTQRDKDPATGLIV